MKHDKPTQHTKPGDKVGYDYKEGQGSGKVVKVKPSGERVIKRKDGSLTKKRQADLKK